MKWSAHIGADERCPYYSTILLKPALLPSLPRRGSPKSHVNILKLHPSKIAVAGVRRPIAPNIVLGHPVKDLK